MESQRLTNLVQVVTAVTVSVGLALVIWELRQTRQFMEFDLVDRTFAETLATRRAEIGENPLVSYAKACSGEPLTVEDRLVLDNYFWMHFTGVTRSLATSSKLDFRGGGGEGVTTKIAFQKIFAVNQGRIWFESIESLTLENQGPALRRAVQIGRKILDQGVPPCSYGD